MTAAQRNCADALRDLMVARLFAAADACQKSRNSSGTPCPSPRGWVALQFAFDAAEVEINQHAEAVHLPPLLVQSRRQVRDALMLELVAAADAGDSTRARRTFDELCACLIKQSGHGAMVTRHVALLQCLEAT